MKTRRFFIALLALAGLSACQEPEEAIVPNVPGQFDLTATFEVTEGMSFTWAANDEITVYDGKSVNPFVTAEGGEAAVFSGLANKKAEMLQAIYPATNGGRYSGKVNVTLPTSQDAVAVFPKERALFAANASTSAGALKFQPVVSFLKITLDKRDRVVSLELKANAEEPLTGAVKVDLAGLSAEPAEAAVPYVMMTGLNMDGANYMAVLPQTLSQGYTLSFVCDDERRYSVSVPAEAVFEQNKIYDLGSYSDIQWETILNDKPTALPSAVLVKAGFQEAEFNMVSEGSFEYYPDQEIRYRTPWLVDSPWAATVNGHDGTPALCFDLTPDKFNWHQIVQVCALRQNKNYVHSAWATTTHFNTYFACKVWPSGGLQEIGGGTWGPTEEWTKISHIVNPGNDILADVYVGAWWEPVMVAQYDEISIIPEGYTAKSTAPKSQEKIGTVINATFDKVDNLGKVIAWKNSKGKICFILSDFTVNGVHYDTAVAQTEDTELTGNLTIALFAKSAGKFIPISVPGEGIVSIVPNDVFLLNGKTYLHYYAKKWQNPDNADDWTVDHAGFLVSEDDGVTWTKCNGKWSGNGTFCSASFVEKDGMLYMLGTNAGRKIRHLIHEFHRSNFYFARVSTDKDITDPKNWEYYNCKEWTNVETIYTDDGADANRIVMGSRGECALVWNPKFERFMMIYRDGRQEGLVYRDAASVDDEWSGEKPLAYDDLAAGIFAPSVLEVTDNGELILFASQL